MILKEIPTSERPREKVMLHGVESLTNIELIAILIRVGNKNENVLDVAKQIVYLFDNIASMTDLTVNELTQVKGIGESKAITILAAIELGKRMAAAKAENLFFSTPEAIFEYFYPRLKHVKNENLYVIYLDIKGKVIAIKHLTVGTINQTLIDSKDIFKWAYKYSSTSFILVHNHPSGDPTPSIADLKVTTQLVQQAKIVQFEVIDHIIIGESFFSMRRSCKNYKVF